MRKRTKLVLIAASMILGFLGMAPYKTSQVRIPASQQKWVPQELGKHLAPIKAKILPLEQTPDSGDHEVTLVGQITINSSVDSDLSYAWTLPEGVSVVEGVLSDQLPHVQPGQIVELKIAVIGFSKEHQSQVSLKASAQKGPMEMGAAALISSRPEDSWEAVAPEMQKAAEESLGSEKFHKSR
ncbi:MAG: hypothetical protein ACM3MG_06215 [Bacillota bacterium]